MGSLRNKWLKDNLLVSESCGLFLCFRLWFLHGRYSSGSESFSIEVIRSLVLIWLFFYILNTLMTTNTKVRHHFALSVKYSIFPSLSIHPESSVNIDWSFCAHSFLADSLFNAWCNSCRRIRPSLWKSIKWIHCFLFVLFCFPWVQFGAKHTGLKSKLDLYFFKVTLINICILAVDLLMVCNVRGVARSDKRRFILWLQFPSALQILLASFSLFVFYGLLPYCFGSLS